MTEYEVTSPRTADYNCIAWAMEEDDRWWSPTSEDYYWPEGAPQEWTVAAVIQTLILLGFSPCNDVSIEPGFQKIALFATQDGEPSHVARQLPDGSWTSKLGDWEDIQHELTGIEGEEVTIKGENMKMYGTVQQVLKRSHP
ncbi:MAG: hypothetical protein F6K30_26415 [Cyanothece sp. SIO2G6]|nr:hypothetical protein [Cyanothece sp. SIO2G6]